MIIGGWKTVRMNRYIYEHRRIVPAAEPRAICDPIDRLGSLRLPDSPQVHRPRPLCRPGRGQGESRPSTTGTVMTIYKILDTCRREFTNFRGM